MKSAVSGGSGVVGGAVVRHLLAAGDEVTVLARSPAAAGKIRSMGANTHRGDVLDFDRVLTLIRENERVFHVAGINQMCTRNPGLMDRVNIEGTRNVLEAARRAGQGRVIHTSSTVTLGEEPGSVGSETTVHRGYYLSRYERSKVLAERLALEYADDVDVVIVNPSSVQGPGRTTGTGKLILDAARGRLPFLVDTRFSIVDIDDCARGHLLAAERGGRGERYVLSGFTIEMRDAIRMLAHGVGREPSTRILPVWMVRLAAAAIETGFSLAQRQPPVCREMVRVLASGADYDGSKASEELGLEYRPAEDTLRRTVEWFRQQDLLG